MGENLLENDLVVQTLREAMAAQESLSLVPKLVKRIIKEDMWQARIIEATGEKREFDARDFVAFVNTPPLDGLGTDVRTLQNICRDDAEALKLLRDVTVAAPHKHHDTDNISITRPSHGTSKAYTLQQLESKAPELYQQVLAGTMSAHAAAVKAGLRKRYVSVRPTVEGLARAAGKHLDSDQIVELIERLIQVRNQ